MILIPTAWISYGVILLQSYFWPSGNPYELFLLDHHCGIAFGNIRPLMYTAFFVYVFPIFCIFIFYTWVLLFIRTQVSQALVVRRAQRDVVVARRIFLTVNCLTLPAVANGVLIIITHANPNSSASYSTYRIRWLAATTSVFISSISLVVTTPQLKDTLLRKLQFRKNRVMPTHDHNCIAHVPVNNQHTIK